MDQEQKSKLIALIRQLGLEKMTRKEIMNYIRKVEAITLDRYEFIKLYRLAFTPESKEKLKRDTELMNTWNASEKKEEPEHVKLAEDLYDLMASSKNKPLDYHSGSIFDDSSIEN
jgi:hypothetical protein